MGGRCALLARRLWELRKGSVEDEGEVECMEGYRWRGVHVRYDDGIYEESTSAVNSSSPAWVAAAGTRYPPVFDWTFLDDGELWQRYSYMGCSITSTFS